MSNYMQIVCPRCLILQSNTKYCSNCGKKLATPEEGKELFVTPRKNKEASGL